MSFVFAPLKCLITTLFFSSDNFNLSRLLRLNLKYSSHWEFIFSGCLISFFKGSCAIVAITIIYLCKFFTHVLFSELSFSIESVGFSSGGKLEKRLVVSIEVLSWSLNLDVLAGFFGYS